MAKKKTQTGIYQLKITMKNIEPAIWRRIQVRGDVTLFRLHEYIQGFMGWENYHMHEFRIKGQGYGKPDPLGAIPAELRKPRGCGFTGSFTVTIVGDAEPNKVSLTVQHSGRKQYKGIYTHIDHVLVALAWRFRRHQRK